MKLEDKPLCLTRDDAGPVQLLVIGDLGVDLVIGSMDRWPEFGSETVFDRHEMRVGGSGGNAALAAFHLNGSARLIASLGDDALAQWLRKQIGHLATELQEYAAPTSLSVGLLHPWNERTFLTTRGHLDVTEYVDMKALIPVATGRSIALLSGVFLMPGLRRHYAELIAHLRVSGYEIAIDSGCPGDGWTPAVRAEFAPWLAQCDHLLLNESETLGLARCDDLGEALCRLAAAARAGATIIAKTGPQGAVAFAHGEIVHHRAEPLAIFDTVGAGDAFNAGYLLACTNDNGTEERLAAGCRAAAQIISHFPRGQMLRPAMPETR